MGKDIYEKPTAHIIPDGERPEAFPEIRNKIRMPASVLLVNIALGVLARAIKNLIWEGFFFLFSSVYLHNYSVI